MTFDDPDHPMDEYYAKAKEARALIVQMRAGFYRIAEIHRWTETETLAIARQEVEAAELWITANP